MISADIEKEIKTEHKVFLGLSLRKLIVAGISLFLIIVFSLTLGFEMAMYLALGVGVVAVFFGWYTKDGLTAEYLLLKKLQSKYYKTDQRSYRSKNRYVSLINNEYTRRKNIDLSNKAIAKQMKKEMKQNEKRVKQSKLKPIN